MDGSSLDSASSKNLQECYSLVSSNHLNRINISSYGKSVAGSVNCKLEAQGFTFRDAIFIRRNMLIKGTHKALKRLLSPSRVGPAHTKRNKNERYASHAYLP